MKRLLSRLAAVGLLGLVLAAAVFGVVRPTLAHLDGLEQRIADLKAQLQGFRDRLATTERRAEIEVADKALLTGNDPALAAAALQTQLREAAEAAGADLRSVTVERSLPAAPGLLGVPVTGVLEGDVSALQALLYRLETGDPYVVIARLDARRARRSPGPEERAPRLVISLRLTGYIAAAGE
ncbi:MAG: type II secretion system protein GspM [Pikeienuella sp.]